MDKNRFLSGRKRVPGLLVINVLFIVVIAGCDVVENTEGEQTSLCLDYFQQCVNPVFLNANNNCASSGCHLGGTTTSNFEVEPTGDILSFKETQDVARSGRLIARPQQPDHTGGTFAAFADSANGCVQEINAWLSASVDETPEQQQFGSPAACQLLFPCVRPDPAAQC